MSKLMNSKMFWSVIILVLGFVFCVQLGMQIRGTPEETKARELDQQIERVTVQEAQVRASLPSSERPEQELATLHSNDSSN